VGGTGGTGAAGAAGVTGVTGATGTFANIPTNTIVGNNSGVTGAPTALTPAQVDAVILAQPRGTTTVAMAGSTTTLTSASTRQQLFTGSGTTAQIVILPAANTLPFTDWAFEIDNASTGTGAITVQTNGGTFLTSVAPGASSVINCTSIATAPGTWDVDFMGNLQTHGTQTIASAGSTTTLTVGSPRQTIVTGTNTQIFVLPNATTLPFVDWQYEFVNQSSVSITIQTSDAAVLAIIPAGFDLRLNCTSIGTAAGTWQFLSPSQFMSQTSAPPVTFSGLDMWGHSYIDNTNVGNSVGNILPNINYCFVNIFAASMGIPFNKVVNHAVTGAILSQPVRGGALGSGGGFAKVLADIYKTKIPSSFPFGRNGNAHLVCFGVNDTGNNTPGNQAALNTAALDTLTVLVAKMRASVVVNGNSTSQGLAYTGTWTAAATAANDYTSGFAWQTTATGGVFTFTIPIGYQGEPITIAMVGYNAAAALTVTFSGSAGVTGTTTLNSRGIYAQCMVPKRITNLTAQNAGQTIIGTVALTGATFLLDGIYIESKKPVPVLLCNQPRLPSRLVTIISGGGVTTGVNTSFTDASGNFTTAGDAGQTLTELDAQGAFTGSTNTISSVTNGTTVVLGTNAASAKTAIKYSFPRKWNGYPTNSWTNTNFTGATVASHAAADTDVQNWNTNVIVACKNLFDSMVQIVDLDAAIGTATEPAGITSWWDEVSLAHPNELGNQICALACWKAASLLQQPVTDLEGIGVLQNSGQASYSPAGYRRTILNTAISNAAGALYLPDGATLDVVANVYTCVVGDCFAYPIMVSEAGIYAMGCSLEQVGTTGTSTVRVGLYDDMGGPGGPWGYPQTLRADGGNTLMTASNAVKALGNFFRAVYPGLWWVVMAVQTLGTASTFRTIYGPCPQLPSWNGTVNGIVRPIAWKITGLAAGAFPSKFPTGGVLVGAGGGTFASASSAPLVATMLNVF
jgi:hypothetical protein